MKTLDTTPLPHGRDLKTKLEYLRSTHYGPESGEALHTWLERLQEDGHAILLDRRAAGDARNYRRARKKAMDEGVVLVAIDPPVENSDEPRIVLSRAQARDVKTYRAARAEAKRKGARLVIRDDE